MWDGRLYTIPNFQLYNTTIQNVRRSPPQSDFFPIQIMNTTPVEKIRALEVGLLDYFRSRPDFFNVERSGIYCNQLANNNLLTVMLVVTHTCNWFAHEFECQCCFIQK